VVAFYLPGGIPVYVFPLLVALGALAGMFWIFLGAPVESRWRRIDAGLWTLLGSLIGGRLAYVVVNWAYFQSHLLETGRVNLGGLSWPGALAGGLFTLVIYSAFSRQSLGELADAVLPMLIILPVSVWLGCWLDGSAYGWNTTAWWGLPAMDEWGVTAQRFPVQLLGVCANLILIFLLWQFSKRRQLKPGVKSSLALFGVSASLFGLSLLRADPTLYWREMRLDAWIALYFLILSVIMLIGFQVKGSNPQSS